jgi:hypothetical protein
MIRFGPYVTLTELPNGIFFLFLFMIINDPMPSASRAPSYRKETYMYLSSSLSNCGVVVVVVVCKLYFI